jgi:hypothetical protein
MISPPIIRQTAARASRSIRRRNSSIRIMNSISGGLGDVMTKRRQRYSSPSSRTLRSYCSNRPVKLAGTPRVPSA